MVRLTYCIEGVRVEEILNARRERVTSEMIDSMEDVYIFEREKIISGELAKRYIKKLQDLYI